jgi:hypothetical protein
MKTVLAFTAGLAVAAAACPSLAADKGSCFRMSQMQGHTVVDGSTLYVGISGSRDVYRITTAGNCLAAKTSSDPLITRSVGGSDLVCKPIDLDLAVGGMGGPSHCIVNGIQKLTPAEVAALPKKLKP